MLRPFLAPGLASCGMTGRARPRSRRCPPEVRARAREPHRLILTKANSRSTVHRPSYLDYIAVKRLAARVRSLASTGSSACTPTPPSPRPSPDSGAQAQARRGTRRHPASAPTATTARISPSSWISIRARNFSWPRSPSWSPSRRTCSGCASACTPGCSCARTSTAGTCPAWCTCRETGTRPRSGCAPRSSCSARCSAGAQMDYSVLVGESPVARLYVVVRAERGRLLPDVDAAGLEANGGRRPLLGRRPGRGGRPPLGEERARELLPRSASDPADLQDRRARIAATDDLARSCSCAVGRDVAFDLWESEDYVGGVPIGTERRRARRPPVRRQAGLAADDLPHHLPDHADRRAATAAAHGPGPGRRASVRVPGAAPRFWIYDFGLRADRDRPAHGLARPSSDRVGQELVQGALSALWRGTDRGRRLQRAGPRRAADLAAGGGAARLRQVPAAGEHTFSQDYIERVLRANVTVTRLLVRLFESGSTRTGTRGRRSAARPSSRRSGASSTRSPASTMTVSCAPTAA